MAQSNSRRYADTTWLPQSYYDPARANPTMNNEQRVPPRLPLNYMYQYPTGQTNADGTQIDPMAAQIASGRAVLPDGQNEYDRPIPGGGFGQHMRDPWQSLNGSPRSMLRPRGQVPSMMNNYFSGGGSGGPRFGGGFNGGGF